MKIFTKLAALAAIAISIAACGGNAQAAPTVAASNGNAVYGAAGALVIKKDTASGYNRIAVRYSSGWQYVADDAAWSKHARFVQLLGANAIPVGDGDATHIVIAASNGIYCQSGNSVVAFPNAPAETVAGCAFFQAAVAASQ